MSTFTILALVLGLTVVAVILAGVCYGIKEGVARLIEKGVKDVNGNHF